MHRTLASLIALLLVPTSASATPAPVDGIWINPHHSVAVRTGSCGQKVCGWVIWASGKALGDARDGGVAQLIGTRLLENYRPTGPASWSGTVFVPDLNRHFSSELTLLTPNEVRIKGCILGGLICKSQLWTRVGREPQ